MIKINFLSLLKNIIIKHYYFGLIFFLALILRLYNLEILTTFGHDQGIDFLKVRDIAINHDWTLIGIKASLGNFYQGPLYLYLLLPLFWLMKMNPLAGPLTAIVVSLSAICLFYFVLVKNHSKTAALIGTLIFAVSPQFIQYGNTPLYEHFTPPFYILCFYFLYQSTTHPQDKKQFLAIFLTGFFAALSMELHFLSTTLAFVALLYLLIKRSDKIQSFLISLFGLILGLLPTIIFELKHNFFNTNNIFQYLLSSPSQVMPLSSKLEVWIQGASTFYGAENKLLGIVILLVIIYILSQYRKNSDKLFKFFSQITFLLFITTLIFTLKLSSIGWWYPLPFWTSSLFLISIYFAKHLTNKLLYLLLIFIIITNFLFSFSVLKNNQGFYMSTGWNLNKMEQVTDTIVKDANGDKANFNIISFLDGTRAYPLRYLLEIKGKHPGQVTDYNQNNALYIVSPQEIDQILPSKLWELQEFSPFKVSDRWTFEDKIYLYRLDKIRNR